MLPYIFLILIPLIIYSVSLIKNKQYIGLYNDKENSNPTILVFFILLFFLLALRSISVGTDLVTYNYFWERYKDASIFDVFSFNSENDVEELYILLNIIVGYFTDNFQWFLTVIALIQTVIIAALYVEDGRYAYLKIILFVNMATFVMLFSGLRQSLATVLGILAYRMVRKKKIIPFLCVVVIAFFIHRSSFILLPLYPVYRLKFRRKHFWFFIIVFVFVFLLKSYIFNILTRILSNYSHKYDVSIERTLAYGMLILFLLFALFSVFFVDENKMTEEDFGLRNILLLAVLLQIFATINTLSMRFNYYFIILIPVAIPKMICCCIDERKIKFVKVLRVVLGVFFTAYFIYSLYNSYGNAEKMLGIVPYSPFWK